MEESIIHDVVVVGAGLSGLRTSSLLKDENISVLLLEAQDRVGGRTDSVKIDNYNWDLGGQWVGPTQYRINELVKDCNQTTFPQQQKGKKVMEINGTHARYTSLIPPIGLGAVIECQLVVWRLDYLSRDLDVTQPWNWKHAEHYDSISMRDWMEDHMYFETSKKLIYISILAVFSAEPKDISVLFAMTYFKSAGGVSKTIEVEGGAQQDRIYGSSHNISNILSKKLLIPSAIKIEHDYKTKDIIRTTTRNIKTNEECVYLSKYLVLTVPPNIADTIVYQPELPTIRRQLTKSTKMGKVIKFIIFYQDCWWRDLGFSGEVVSDRPSISFCYDGSFEDGSKSSIIGFFEGDYAIEWGKKSELERKNEAMAFIYQSFSDDRAFSPTNYLERNWASNPWSNGGYGCIMGPHDYSNYGKALREPIGNIHFAGTETATEWAGYMEGALQSAERVSNEIIPKFNSNYKPQLKTNLNGHSNNLNFLNYLIMISSMVLIVILIFYNLLI
ncbi:hypothetical protein DICPUDRAFT_58486 [Dictyostelium purpureum]|uniref:Amine oxidase n=1 Tax=Dictyostelium purpureum TaxID=5786 RepID=F1A178_DICPU|nr:uncharacterized protein DICPUDRAFT_58486 [Dictyostelium purpureum]EGC30059.1 hypothetical protein DICPUDRAFT_58486 [Dictyostelium purpureum]|eukprot:XP_003293422.1 hypothetical protein DICPUDRAFT_58486 [Dictyostelium purpureum]